MDMQVQHRRKVQVHARGAKLAAHRRGDFLCQCRIPQPPQFRGRRPLRKGIRQAELRAALLVNADQRSTAGGTADFVAQRAQPIHALPVAPEQRHARQPAPKQLRKRIGTARALEAEKESFEHLI